MTMFIRFGDAPADGKSWNDDLCSYEAGVSVYPAEWGSADHDVISVFIPDDTCVGTISNVSDRDVYVVTGRLLDQRGGDGEPLLADVTTIHIGPVEVVNYVIDEEW